MLRRNIRLGSGLEITQESDTKLSWEYHSDVLGKLLEGTLTHTNERGGGWIIDIDTPGFVVLAMVYFGPPQPLPDAISEVGEMIKRTEAEHTKPDPSDERRKRELDDLFDGLHVLT